MGYEINLGGWNNIFAVPAAVADNYLKLATGSSIKVLLYFLRHAGEKVTAEEISASSGVKPDDVNDAFLFWEQIGLLSEVPNESNGEKTGIFKPSRNTVENPLSPAQKLVPAISLKKIELEREPRFMPGEIAKTVRGNDEVNYLFKQCEKLYGRPLKHNEQNSLMLITEDAGLPVAAALMLVEYCFSITKSTPAFMKSLALNWLERDITTVEKAEEEIKRLKVLNSAENKIKRLFEMNCALSKEQKNYIDKWFNKYGFETEMIDEAYQLTLNKTGKLSFNYMDKIITGWFENGIKNKEQLTLSQKHYKDKTTKNEKSAPSFDLDDFTRAAMEKYS